MLLILFFSGQRIHPPPFGALTRSPLLVAVAGGGEAAPVRLVPVVTVTGTTVMIGGETAMTRVGIRIATVLAIVTREGKTEMMTKEGEDAAEALRDAGGVVPEAGAGIEKRGIKEKT